jgi:hypothetical protein
MPSPDGTNFTSSEQVDSGHTRTPAPAQNPALSSGVLALQNLCTDRPSVASVVQIIDRFPSDRDAMMTMLQQRLGNGFVQTIIAAMRAQRSMAPAGNDAPPATASTSNVSRGTPPVAKSEPESSLTTNGLGASNRGTPKSAAGQFGPQATWEAADRGTSKTGAPVHESSSTLDHVEGVVGRGIIGAYDAERQIESVFRSEPEHPVPPPWLAAVWAKSDEGALEYPHVRENLNAELGPKAALAEAQNKMEWTPERGDRETRAAAAFFQKHPSDAAKTIVWFQSIWNAFDTFNKYPLQAFMYASTSPVTTPAESSVVGTDGEATPRGIADVDREQAPKNELWAAYARASDEHLDPTLIDEAYFRAHIADIKGAMASEQFKELYDLSPANYRIVVEAYAETIGRTELELQKGRPIGDVSRGLFVDGLRDLVKRKSVGMLWTAEGLKNLATLSDSAKLMAEKTVEFAGMLGTSDRPASNHSVVDSVIGWFRDEAAFRRAVSDGTVDAEKVWEITQTLRGFSGVLDRKDLERIRRFAEANAQHLTPAARASVEALLKQGPNGGVSEAEIAAAPKPDVPHGVPVDLTDDQRAILRRDFHIAISSGATTLTEDMFVDATFSEPDRREDKSTPVRQWPLRLSDLTGPQLRPGLMMTGTDGKLTFEKIMGAIRNVQGRVRSKLIDDFDKEYPIAPGGILEYSANVLALNKTYGEDEFYGMVPNAIIPVDNDGKPKNQLWRDFTTAYDQHKKTGTPSKQELEKLWIRAHMEDFRAVDGPEFQAKEDEFWEKAAQDPALESMAVYAKAMILGRQVFEHARAEHMTEEASLYEALKHFGRTIASSGTFPFGAADLEAVKTYFRGGQKPGSKDEPATDDRGLPTDRTIAERAAKGAKEMTGLTALVEKGHAEEAAGTASRVAPEELVDLAGALSPEQLAALDPTILDFYRHPTSYDMTALAEFEPVQGFLLQALSAVSGLGNLPASPAAKPREYAVEQNLWRDQHGKTHWDRDVVVNGEQQALFHATFELVGNEVCETFNVRGITIPLYFHLVPRGRGINLVLDREKSSSLAPPNIVFIVQPAGKDALVVVGQYEGLGNDGGTKAEFHVHKRRSSQGQVA